MSHSIAVVIPAYNAETTVSTAISSALSQSDPPQDIIVVDDGSTDGTADVVAQWGNKVTFIRQTNQGSAVARQAGTMVASAEYIAYLDADDWWPKDKLEVCRHILAQQDIYMMLGDLQRSHVEGGEYLPRNSTFFPWLNEYLKKCASSTSIPDLYRLESRQGLDLLLRGFPMFPSAALVRRSVVLEVGGWDARFRRCQDFDIGLRIARKFPLHYYNCVQAILGLHAVNSDVTAYLVKQTEGDIRVLSAHAEAEALSSRYRADISAALAGKYCFLGYVRRKAGEYELARRAYREALRLPGKRFHALTRWLAANSWLGNI